MYFYFLFLVDINIDQDLIGIIGIIFLGNDHIGIFEPLIIKITFDQCFGTIY